MEPLFPILHAASGLKRQLPRIFSGKHHRLMGSPSDAALLGDDSKFGENHPGKSLRTKTRKKNARPFETNSAVYRHSAGRNCRLLFALAGVEARKNRVAFCAGCDIARTIFMAADIAPSSSWTNLRRLRRYLHCSRIVVA